MEKQGSFGFVIVSKLRFASIRIVDIARYVRMCAHM